MTALDDLKAYAAALQEKRALERQMERMGITGAPAGIRGGLRTSAPSTNDRASAALQALDGLEQTLSAVLLALGEKARRGEAALNLIDYGDARTIMRCYYVLRMSDREIAAETFLSRSAVQRIRAATERDLDAQETG